MGNDCGIATGLHLKEQTRYPYHIKDLTQPSSLKQQQHKKISQRGENLRNNILLISTPPCKLMEKRHAEREKSSVPVDSSILEVYKIEPKIIGIKILRCELYFNI